MPFITKICRKWGFQKWTSKIKQNNKNKFCQSQTNTTNIVCCLSTYITNLLFTKVLVYLGKSQPASTITFNSQQQYLVYLAYLVYLILSQHSNIVGLNSYNCLLQVQACSFKNWQRYNFFPTVSFLWARDRDPLTS